jgi:hypothetical protein
MRKLSAIWLVFVLLALLALAAAPAASLAGGKITPTCQPGGGSGCSG